MSSQNVVKPSTKLNTVAYTTAIALACFSGAVATYGLTKFAPGAEFVIAAMGVLFEAGKLASFALVHKQMPRSLKAALVLIGLVLMTLNVAGVSGSCPTHTSARTSAHRRRTTPPRQTLTPRRTLSSANLRRPKATSPRPVRRSCVRATTRAG